MKKITLSLFASFFLLLSFAQPGSQSNIMNINSFLPFQGYDETTTHFGKGEYQIFYDNVDGVFDKPFIIVEGFDPDDSNTIDVIYNYLDYNGGANNLLDDLRNQGLDIVVLNFPTYTRSDDNTIIKGGADYIERNGLVLVNLLELLKPQLAPQNDFIVMGVSMGGLVSRYALSYMEQNAMNHRTGIWFSFDSPHRGANVPISIQYLINYIAEFQNNADMAALRDNMLNVPAAKQMLVDHYSAHLQTSSNYLQNNSIQLPTPAANFRSTFVNTMNTLGFPTQTRKLAIANGSLNATMVQSPGTQIINTNLSLNGQNINIKLYFTPNANISNFQVTRVGTVIIIPITLFSANAASPSTSAGFDSAPGGTLLFNGLFGPVTDPVVQQIINDIQIDSFSFIPTLSSLAIENTNWYQNISISSSTPFDRYIGPTINEPHITLNPQNIAFILEEISNHFLNIAEVQNQELVIYNNPTHDFIQFSLSNQNVQNVQVELFDLTGQLLLKRNLIDFSHEIINIECPSKNGLYILRVNADGKILSKKIIVK